MYKRRLMSVIAAVTMLVLTSAGPAWAAPPLPSSFYGEIHFSDSPPGAGDQVSAYVPGVTGSVGSTTIEDSAGTLVYTIDVLGDDADTPGKDGGVEDDTITFEINGRVVVTATWHSGTNVNLHFHPPEALSGGPYLGDEGSAISFNGSANDWGGDATKYEWDWDNDGTYDETGQNVTHTWTDDGLYTVGLKVTDAQGGQGTATVDATVNNVAPTATFSAPSPVNEGQDINLSLTSPSDPSSDDTAAGFEYAFDCGTGYGDWSGTSATACPTTDDGSVTVKGKIRDKDLAETEYADTVTVNNVAPTATFNAPSPVNEGQDIDLSLTSPTDPSPDDTAAGFEYAFDCGTGYGDWSGTSTTACPTTDDGSVAVKGKIRDKDLAESEYADTVTVNNIAPTATFNAPSPVNEGQDIDLSLTSPTDPSSDDTAAGFEYAFDCGTGYGDWSGTSATACPTTDDGSVTVKGKIRDKDLAETEYADTVTVNDVLPTADAAGPYIGMAGTPVNLSGSATCAPVDTCTYAWDLDNNGQYDDAYIQGPSYTWYAIGDYTVSLRVTDDDGSSADDDAEVHISGATHTIGLLDGWNLVSFRLQPVSTVISDVLSTVDGNYDLVYGWNGTSQSWLKYDNIPLSPDSLQNLDETTGFWIRMIAADTLEVVGSVPTTTDISWYSTGDGWNLVAYPSASDADLPGALGDHGVGTDFSLVYAYGSDDSTDPWKRFDPAAPDWSNDLTYLAPGWGYWVQATADHTWSVVY